MAKQVKVTNFYELGLLYGDTLTFAKNLDIKCKVVSSSKVIYKGEQYSLSSLTNLLLTGTTDPNSTNRYNGWDNWLFNGDLINNRRVLLKKHLAIQLLQDIRDNG